MINESTLTVPGAIMVTIGGLRGGGGAVLGAEISWEVILSGWYVGGCFDCGGPSVKRNKATY